MEYQLLRELTLEMVKDLGSVSFIELVRKHKAFNGDRLMMIYENIVLWEGLSLIAIEVLSDLYNEKLIEFTPCDSFIYAIDGGMLNLPIAKQNRKYKTKRWLPVLLNPYAV